VIEIIVRIVPLYPDNFIVYDRERGWRFDASMTGTHLYIGCLGEFSNLVTINSQGLHDIEHPYDPSPNSRRILIIGDSTVASFEVPLDQSFYRQLETQLNEGEPAQPFDIIGAGHRGYGTDLEWLFYQMEGYRYQADMVLLIFQPGNDIRDNHPELRRLGIEFYPYYTLDESGELVLNPPVGTGEPGPISINPIHDTLYNASLLYRLLFERQQWLTAVSQTFVQSEDADTATRQIDEAWAITGTLIEAMRNNVEEDGAQFAVVIAPGGFQTESESEAIHDRLADLLNTLEIRFLDLEPAFKAAEDSGQQTLRFACDHHWTAAGHALVAGELAGFLPDLFATD
jgi:hypothetical protein